MPIPQNLSTTVENPTEGSSDNGTRPGHAPRGEGGLEDSTAVFHTARVRRGLDVLSVVKSLGQRGWTPRILPARRREPGSRSSEDRYGWRKANGRISRTTGTARRCTVSGIGCGPGPVARSWRLDAAKGAHGSPSDLRERGRGAIARRAACLR